MRVAGLFLMAMVCFGQGTQIDFQTQVKNRDSTYLNYTPSQSGTITRATNTKLNETLSIRDFSPGIVAGNTAYDNGPAINAACANAASTGADILFPNANGNTPVYYYFSTPITCSATSQNYTLYSSGGSASVVLAYNGSALSSSAAVSLTGPSDGTTSAIVNVRGIRFTTLSNVLAIFKEDFLDGGIFENNIIDPNGKTVTYCLLSRGSQLTTKRNNYIVDGCTYGWYQTDLQSTLGAVSGTITSSISSSGVGTFTVSSSGLCNAITAYETVTVESENIRATCSGTTVTPASECGPTGNLSCRGNQQTTAVSHTSGAAATTGFNFSVDQVNATANTTYGLTCGVWQDTPAAGFGGTVSYFSGRFFGDATSKGYCHTAGNANFGPGNQFEGTAGYLGYVANRAGAGSSNPYSWWSGLNVVVGPSTVSTGSIFSSPGVTFWDLTIASPVAGVMNGVRIISAFTNNASPNNLTFCSPSGVPSSGACQLPPKTVANLPACAALTSGVTGTATDSNTNTWGANLASGGALNVGIRCNGTNWTITGK